MILRGTCTVFVAFDVGRSIDLAAAERRLDAPAPSQAFRRKHGVRTLEGPDSPALRVRLQWAAPDLGDWDLAPEVEVALYPFGALCVTWRVDFDAELPALIDLSVALYSNKALIVRSREVVRQVLEELGDSVRGPQLSLAVEDYVVFHVRPTTEEASVLLKDRELARLLRAEAGPLDEGEIDNALAGRIAYARGEACYVDWLAALLVGRDMDDELLVLESATVELLELRLLDNQLAEAVEESHGVLDRPRGLLRAFRPELELDRVARLQADNAVLHEGFDNALRLVGDDYLARLYRTAARRFHYAEWDESIDRKLGVLDGIYRRLSDEAAQRRAEALEWIIILLIAVEIVFFFL